MKNKKIIFLVATVCCLAVCWLCFGAWTIVDTSYQLSDFQYSTSIAYLYIVPSSNIPSTEYSNIQVSGVYTNPGTSSTVQTSAFAGTLSSFSSNTTCLYFKSSTAFSSNRAVRLDVGISAIDTSIGTYVITGSYIVDSTPSLVASPSYRVFSNYSYAQIGNSQYRTLILFIDKVSGVSQEQYNELLEDYNQAIQDKLTLQEGYVNLRSDYDDLQIMYNNLASDYNTLHTNYDTLNSNYNTLVTDFNNLSSEYDILHAKWEEQVFKWQDEYTERIRLEQEVARLEDVIASMGSGGSALDFIGTAFEKVGDILQIEILPNITIGTIVAVPLILGVVFLVLRLVRGE